MKRQAKEEALRWLIQAKDEFEDADELRKRGRFYLALFFLSAGDGKSPQGVSLPEGRIR
ncbi:hypothetical protein [Methanocella conradii]|uniref:hypothetical protein n=1 Tax=Methanocella conradii TaxID=1175444 RepID=UPI001305269C|nr:hypothetical protein [Methanocella conradii]